MSAIRSKIPLHVLSMIARRPGGMVRFDLLGRTLIVISSAESVDHVLTNTKGYDKDAPMYTAARPFLGQSLTVSRGGADWRLRRRVVQPLFHRSRRLTASTAVERCLEDIVARWTAHAVSSTETNIAHEMRRLCMEIACRTLFGLDATGEVDGLVADFRTVSDHVVASVSMPRLLRRRRPGFHEAMRRIETFVDRVLARGSSVLTEVVDNAALNAMPREDLRDELVGLLFAGHETLADTLTWCLHLVMRHPLVAATVRSEARTVLSGRIASFEDVPRLPYARMVVQEAMRLYPVVWLSMRRALRADVIGGRPVPAGALVVWSPYVVNRDPAVWQEPERFRPERFEAGGPIRDVPGFRPFGAGQRACAGADLAYAEACATLSTLLQHFQLVPHDPHASSTPRPAMTLRPEADPVAFVHNTEREPREA